MGKRADHCNHPCSKIIQFRILPSFPHQKTTKLTEIRISCVNCHDQVFDLYIFGKSNRFGMSIEDRGVVVDVIDVDVHTHVAVTSCRSENKHFMR